MTKRTVLFTVAVISVAIILISAPALAGRGDNLLGTSGGWNKPNPLDQNYAVAYGNGGVQDYAQLEAGYDVFNGPSGGGSGALNQFTSNGPRNGMEFHSLPVKAGIRSTRNIFVVGFDGKSIDGYQFRPSLLIEAVGNCTVRAVEGFDQVHDGKRGTEFHLYADKLPSELFIVQNPPQWFLNKYGNGDFPDDGDLRRLFSYGTIFRGDPEGHIRSVDSNLQVVKGSLSSSSFNYRFPNLNLDDLVHIEYRP